MTPPRPVCLVGLRGAGKTTLGRALAAARGREFLDLDDLLEARASRPLGQLLAEDPGAFRALEAELLQESLALHPAAVLATGGGAVLSPGSRAALRAAWTVYLRASPAVLAARVSADPRSAARRPPLRSGEDPLHEARRLLAEREPLYLEVAAATVDADRSTAQVLASVLALAP